MATVRSMGIGAIVISCPLIEGKGPQLPGA